ncbi:MAG: hypothetical protein R3F62_13900 [Planctomycetota bacterium]
MEQPAQTLTVLVHTAAVLACGLFAGGCGGGGGGGGGAGGGGGSGTVAVAFGAASNSVGESGGTTRSSRSPWTPAARP